MKQGDTVLDLGRQRRPRLLRHPVRAQRRRIPVCVVSSPEKAEIVRRMGAELVIDRSAEGYRFWKDEHNQDPKEWQRFGKRIRELTGGEDIDIVFEHPGRETFGASVYVTKKGGTITTCASTSGYMHHYDNRYFWMNLKRIVGSHFANYRESWEANRLIAKGLIHPTLSQDLRPRRHRPGGVRRPQEPAPGQGRRAVPGPEEGLGVAARRRRSSGPSTSRRSTASATSDARVTQPAGVARPRDGVARRRGGRTRRHDRPRATWSP